MAKFDFKKCLIKLSCTHIKYSDCFVVCCYFYIYFRIPDIFNDLKNWQNSLTPGDTIIDTVTLEQLKIFLTTMDAKYGKNWLTSAVKDAVVGMSRIIIEDPVQFAQSVYGLYNH